jgi:hypothetical protein
VDLIPLLSAKYAIRQNASAFLVLWAFFLLLAGGSIVARRARSTLFAVAFTLFALGTAGLGILGFWWGASSAAGSLGMATPYFSDRDWCLALGLNGVVSAWIVLTVTFLGALGLIVLGGKRRAPAVRIPAFLGAAILLFLTAVVALLSAFNYSWCGSHRLF